MPSSMVHFLERLTSGAKGVNNAMSDDSHSDIMEYNFKNI